MSSDGRAPWWYSGDEDEPVAGAAEPDARGVPDPAPDGDLGEQSDGTSPAMDWTALVAGAAKMVDWATERVMAPHAEHTDPAEHPECMVCRTVTLIGDPVGLLGGGDRPLADADPISAVADSAIPAPEVSPGAPPIRWIPIVETSD